jgi:hypothetical protein
MLKCLILLGIQAIPALSVHVIFNRFGVRFFVNRDTLWRLERGNPTVALGTLGTATFVLNLHDRLANLASPASDELALSLDERRLPQRIRRTRP